MTFHLLMKGGLIVAILGVYIYKIIRQQSNEYKGILSSFMFFLSFIHNANVPIELKFQGYFH